MASRSSSSHHYSPYLTRFSLGSDQSGPSSRIIYDNQTQQPPYPSSPKLPAHFPPLVYTHTAYPANSHPSSRSSEKGRLPHRPITRWRDGTTEMQSVDFTRERSRTVIRFQAQIYPMQRSNRSSSASRPPIRCTHYQSCDRGYPLLQS